MKNRKPNPNLFFIGLTLVFTAGAFMLYDLFHVAVRIVIGILGITMIVLSRYKVI